MKKTILVINKKTQMMHHIQTFEQLFDELLDGTNDVQLIKGYKDEGDIKPNALVDFNQVRQAYQMVLVENSKEPMCRTCRAAVEDIYNSIVEVKND